MQLLADSLYIGGGGFVLGLILGIVMTLLIRR